MRALVDHLDTLDLGAPAPWRAMLAPLGELIRGEALIYCVSTASGEARLSFLESPREVVGRKARSDIDASYAQRGGFGLHDPLRVARSQRNRALVLRDLSDDPRRFLRDAGFHKYGLERCDQVRVIVCDGETMRAWFGGFRGDDEPFTTKEQRLLASVLSAFRRRLDLEAALAGCALTFSALDVALEALGRAAVIADGRGRIQHASSLALEARRRDTTAFDGSLADALRGALAPWDVHPLHATGVTGHALLVRRARAARPTFDPPWEVSPREREVLELVALGASNASTAAQLGCSERTVEVHVTRLLQKSGLESRAQLVATLWRTLLSQ